MKKTLARLVALFLLLPHIVQAQNLEELMGSEEIIVCEFNNSMRSFKGKTSDDEVIKISSLDLTMINALRINLKDKKVVGQFNRRVMATDCLLKFFDLLLNPTTKDQVEKMLENGKLDQGILNHEAWHNFKTFCGDTPVHVWADDYIFQQMVYGNFLAHYGLNLVLKEPALNLEFPFVKPFIKIEENIQQWDHNFVPVEAQQHLNFRSALGLTSSQIFERLGLVVPDQEKQSELESVASMALFYLERAERAASVLTTTAAS